MARRSFATMPFLATVIADEKVAAAYHNKQFKCTITISKEKSIISNENIFLISHVLEFAKRFWSDEVTRDFSPVSAKMLRSLVDAIMWKRPLFSQRKD